MDQVRYDGSVWVPPSPGAEPDPAHRDGMHEGAGGLALTLAEIRAVRPWTARERGLADAIGEQVTAGIATSTDHSLFHGLVSAIGTLTALGEPAPDAAVARMLELAGPDGWPQTFAGPPRYRDGARVSDVVLGTAGVLLGAVWARRHGARADELAEVAAGVLLAEREEVPSGLNWRMVPPRFSPVERQLPNFSHGLAGVATSLALAGAEFGRPEWVAAALDGARHLVTLADLSGGGFRAPLRIPRLDDDFEEYSYNWCHGPAGTSLLWKALEHAGVFEVDGLTTAELHRRCVRTLRTCGLPERLWPGFWDNDGRCCGTAGVGAVLLDAGAEPEFARHLADVLVDRAVPDGDGVCWRFVEHRAEEPLLPPGVGWMQGAAGIAAFLFQASRGGPGVPRMDNWWATDSH
ncbi:hypothetical protein ADL03_21465 [Nocardia sp. NRRL S-836]|nr:hypothetical protein ADL03_21465 [Nocardia sp. NRRL S-836]